MFLYSAKKFILRIPNYHILGALILPLFFSFLFDVWKLISHKTILKKICSKKW